uniref:Four helix bundle protein n=1 Tax=candidate division CPR3 bacterium TaxID=2268181 RepID=A0A7V3J9E2_UNCC3
MEEKARIRSFRDLDVYRTAHEAAMLVLKEIVPKLPKEEKDDLGDQLRRSVKAVPRLIAEGFAKRHQVKGFQKYLDDAQGESNESQASLEQCRDAYDKFVDLKICEKLIDTYDKISRQLYNLSLAWNKFYEKRSYDARLTKCISQTQTNYERQ